MIHDMYTINVYANVHFYKHKQEMEPKEKFISPIKFYNERYI